MNVSVHFFVSLICSAILFPFFGWFSILFFVGSFLIDFDHYLDYAISKKDWNLRNSYLFHKNYNGPKTVRLDVFHTFEFWFLLLVLSFFSRIVLFFSLGVLLHMLMDLHNLTLKKKISKSFSVIYWLSSRK